MGLVGAGAPWGFKGAEPPFGARILGGGVRLNKLRLKETDTEFELMGPSPLFLYSLKPRSKFILGIFGAGGNQGYVGLSKMYFLLGLLNISASSLSSCSSHGVINLFCCGLGKRVILYEFFIILYFVIFSWFSLFCVGAAVVAGTAAGA